MLYYAPHSVHMPLEVPAAQLAKFSNITDSVPRQYYTAMTNYVDAHIGQVVSALQAKGMWNNTLLVLLSDNGGPVYGGGSGCTKCNGNAGANNWPLRCGWGPLTAAASLPRPPPFSPTTQNTHPQGRQALKL